VHPFILLYLSAYILRVFQFELNRSDDV